VDDSIVRGTTTKGIINYIKEAGKAREVHVRVSCPPIMAPCFYGIDMSSVSELFAPKFHSLSKGLALPEKTLANMAKDLGADSLVYQSVQGLVKALGLPKENLCMACLNGKYPTHWGCKLYKRSLEGKQVHQCRAYEI
jgi:amidophosphoribosyltransferase